MVYPSIPFELVDSTQVRTHQKMQRYSVKNGDFT